MIGSPMYFECILGAEELLIQNEFGYRQRANSLILTYILPFHETDLTMLITTLV